MMECDIRRLYGPVLFIVSPGFSGAHPPVRVPILSHISFVFIFFWVVDNVLARILRAS